MILFTSTINFRPQDKKLPSLIKSKKEKQSSLKMEFYTMVSGKEMSDKDSEFKFGLMGRSTKATGTMAKPMAEVRLR
jgi:hypothetical protein